MKTRYDKIPLQGQKKVAELMTKHSGEGKKWWEQSHEYHIERAVRHLHQYREGQGYVHLVSSGFRIFAALSIDKEK